MILSTDKTVTSFYEFCLLHRADRDDLGDVCSEVVSDRGAPREDESLRNYLLAQYNDRDLIRRLWRTYLRAGIAAVKSSRHAVHGRR